jgi:hypothetical protein
MRVFSGIVVGCALTFLGLYVADAFANSTAAGQPMVNWQAVGKNVEGLGTLARAGWKKITG